MAIAFRETLSAMATFEKINPNSSRVQTGINGILACYKAIYEEKKRANVRSSLDRFTGLQLPHLLNHPPPPLPLLT
jgi:hypothetical protein